MTRPTTGTWMVLVLAFAAASNLRCQAEPETSDNWMPRVAQLDRDLAPGAAGGDVRAVQEYLTHFGYFPNEELARAYPQWRPLVAAPPNPGSYDGATENAVRAFQRMGGVAQTGVVDLATRQLLQAPRCGLPDGIRNHDSDDKFSLQGSRWGKRTLTWRLGTGAAGASFAEDVRRAARSAFGKWAARTNLTFQESTGSVDMTIRFVPLAPTRIAQAFYPSNGPGNIDFDSNRNWAVVPAGATGFDFETLMLHEVGHVLGLHHSSVGAQLMTGGPAGPVMQPNNGAQMPRRTLTTDDRLAISLLYNPFVRLPGCALDIGANTIQFSNNGAVWVAGCDQRVYKWNDDSEDWDQDRQGGTATRISVDSHGKPWVVQPSGKVAFKNTNDAFNGAWTVTESCALDVGVGNLGSPGSVWVVGCDKFLYRWNGAVWVRDARSWSGFRGVSVDNQGLPWLTTDVDGNYRRSTDDTVTGGFIILPDTGNDIGVHLGGELAWAWLTGNDDRIFAFSDQAGIPNDPDGPFRFQWEQHRDDGRSSRVAVNNRGPWVVNRAGAIHRLLRAP